MIAFYAFSGFVFAMGGAVAGLHAWDAALAHNRKGVIKAALAMALSLLCLAISLWEIWTAP